MFESRGGGSAVDLVRSGVVALSRLGDGADDVERIDLLRAVSYTHLTLPTNREV